MLIFIMGVVACRLVFLHFQALASPQFCNFVLALSAEPALGAALGLDGTSHVLLVGTEGATDAAIYADVVGRTPAEVAR